MIGNSYRGGILRGRTQKLSLPFLLLVIFSIGLAATPTIPTLSAAPLTQTGQLPVNSVVVTITGVNLRASASASAGIVATMPVDARSTVISGPLNGGWYLLDYNGTRGYANGRYLKLAQEGTSPTPPGVPTAATSGSTPSAIPSEGTSPVPTQQAITPTVARPTPTATPALVPPYPAPAAPGDYTGLWLGEMSAQGSVRVGPGTEQKRLKSWGKGRRVLLYGAVTDSKGEYWYRVSEPPEAPMYVHSSLIRTVAPVKFEAARYKGRWININISQQIVTAYEDGAPVKVTLTSTGTSRNPTELGVWKIYHRLPKQDMKGGSRATGDYYYLKDVPYPQYFHMSGEGLHGTYWHDNFGRRMSHGCVNLSTPMAGWFYGWANVGTTVYVHN